MSALGRLARMPGFAEPGHAESSYGGSSDQQRERIVLYDTTLRDGAQTHGVEFSTLDKQIIAAELDRLGVDYIEGGWPGANPTDDAFFSNPPPLHRAKLCAFGTTRRPGRSASNDPSLSAVLGAGTEAVCLVGKASDLAAEIALGVGPEENLDLIVSSVEEAARHCAEVLFDAEHFFDGYLRNPEYALRCLRRAREAGASWLVLCDTNGGTLPEQIAAIVGRVVALLPEAAIGIHLHNDTETAVAGSLAAIAAGARMIQGTLNGLGERCGNANFTALIPTLALKLRYRTGVDENGLRRLTEVSRMLDERLNRTPNPQAAYVGKNAFTHKAGLHAAAMLRDTTSYEHVAPERLGNGRRIIVSNQAGRANLLDGLRQLDLALRPDDPRITTLVETVKRREFEGWGFDMAPASFELLAHEVLNEAPPPFRVISVRASESSAWSADTGPTALCDVAVEIETGGQRRSARRESPDMLVCIIEVFRDLLLPSFPVLTGMRIIGSECRSFIRQTGAKPVTRFIVFSEDAALPLPAWRTMGVSEKRIDALFMALRDAFVIRLLRATGEQANGHAAAF